jgi:hypothetical protein
LELGAHFVPMGKEYLLHFPFERRGLLEDLRIEEL